MSTSPKLQRYALVVIVFGTAFMADCVSMAQQPSSPGTDVRSKERDGGKDVIGAERGWVATGEPKHLRLKWMDQIWDLTLQDAVVLAARAVTADPMTKQTVDHAVDCECTVCTQLSFHREAAVCDALLATERLYWALYLTYRDWGAAYTARDAALRVWQGVKARRDMGLRFGGSREEARARDNYLQKRARAETALANLLGAELKLRKFLDLPIADGKTIRPADELTTGCFSPNWKVSLSRGLSKRMEIRRLKQRVTSLTTQLQAGQHSEDIKHKLARNRWERKQVEKNVTFEIASAFQMLSLHYKTAQTNFNRRVAAADRARASRAGFASGSLHLDELLKSQESLADAEMAYYASLVEYNIAIARFQSCQGTLLEYDNVELRAAAMPVPGTENTWVHCRDVAGKKSVTREAAEEILKDARENEMEAALRLHHDPWDRGDRTPYDAPKTPPEKPAPSTRP